MMMKNRNARFWVYWNGGPVKVTLKPGQAVAAIGGGPHEEGYSWIRELYHHQGDQVMVREDCESRDCDGRTSSFRLSAARLSQLKKRYSEVPEYRYYVNVGNDNHHMDSIEGVRFPDWSGIDERYRDHAAERAGY